MSKRKPATSKISFKCRGYSESRVRSGRLRPPTKRPRDESTTATAGPTAMQPGVRDLLAQCMNQLAKMATESHFAPSAGINLVRGTPHDSILRCAAQLRVFCQACKHESSKSSRSILRKTTFIRKSSHNPYTEIFRAGREGPEIIDFASSFRGRW